MAALFAFQSASHAFTVFLPAVGAALGVIPADGAVVAEAVVSVPARHSVTKSFRVLPLAWRVSLLAVHSAAHALKVFAERVRGAVADEFGVSAGVACAAGDSVDAVSARHSVMKSFFFLPLAWMVALLAFHSSSQAFTVLADEGEEMSEARGDEGREPKNEQRLFHTQYS